MRRWQLEVSSEKWIFCEVWNACIFIFFWLLRFWHPHTYNGGKLSNVCYLIGFFSFVWLPLFLCYVCYSFRARLNFRCFLHTKFFHFDDWIFVICATNWRNVNILIITNFSPTLSCLQTSFTVLPRFYVSNHIRFCTHPYLYMPPFRVSPKKTPPHPFDAKKKTIANSPNATIIFDHSRIHKTKTIKINRLENKSHQCILFKYIQMQCCSKANTPHHLSHHFHHNNLQPL